MARTYLRTPVASSYGTPTACWLAYAATIATPFTCTLGALQARDGVCSKVSSGDLRRAKPTSLLLLPLLMVRRCIFLCASAAAADETCPAILSRDCEPLPLEDPPSSTPMVNSNWQSVSLTKGDLARKSCTRAWLLPACRWPQWQCSESIR